MKKLLIFLVFFCNILSIHAETLIESMRNDPHAVFVKAPNSDKTFVKYFSSVQLNPDESITVTLTEDAIDPCYLCYPFSQQEDLTFTLNVGSTYSPTNFKSDSIRFSKLEKFGNPKIILTPFNGPYDTGKSVTIEPYTKEQFALDREKEVLYKTLFSQGNKEEILRLLNITGTEEYYIEGNNLHTIKEGTLLFTHAQDLEYALFLIEQGADVNALDAKGNNILQKILLLFKDQSNPKLVKFWLQNGVDISHRNNDGKSVMDILDEYLQNTTYNTQKLQHILQILQEDDTDDETSETQNEMN